MAVLLLDSDVDTPSLPFSKIEAEDRHSTSTTSGTTSFADAAYAGLAARAGAELGVTVDIRRRPEGTHWFVPLQPLWRVERTFAWFGRNRRLRHDYEATVTSSQTFAAAAAVAFMLTRLHPNR